MEANSRHEAGKAQSYARKLRDQRSKLEISLQKSSAREEALLKTMAEGLNSAGSEAAAVASALKRAADIEIQLKDAQTNMNDMISEIEAVAEQESTSRSQARRALKHNDEQLILHRRVKEENLQLLEQISSLQLKYAEALAKYDFKNLRTIGISDSKYVIGMSCFRRNHENRFTVQKHMRHES